jgi:hypothetical protein
VSRESLVRVLNLILNESEFLAPYGIRPLSRYDPEHTYTLHRAGSENSVSYEPAESQTGLFGGNSTTLYRNMVETAREEGFPEIAGWFERLAKAEHNHASRFKSGLDSIR